MIAVNERVDVHHQQPGNIRNGLAYLKKLHGDTNKTESRQQQKKMQLQYYYSSKFQNDKAEEPYYNHDDVGSLLIDMKRRKLVAKATPTITRSVSNDNDTNSSSTINKNDTLFGWSQEEESHYHRGASQNHHQQQHVAPSIPRQNSNSNQLSSLTSLSSSSSSSTLIPSCATPTTSRLINLYQFDSDDHPLLPPPTTHRVTSVSDPPFVYTSFSNTLNNSTRSFPYLHHHNSVHQRPTPTQTSQYLIGPPHWAVPSKGPARLELVVDGCAHHHHHHYSNSIDLTKQSFYRIGRSTASDVHLYHESSSRHHALLFHHPHGECYIVDCHSLHGTYIDGKRIRSVDNNNMGIEPHCVRPGSSIRFGGPDAPTFRFNNKLFTSAMCTMMMMPSNGRLPPDLKTYNHHHQSMIPPPLPPRTHRIASSSSSHPFESFTSNNTYQFPHHDSMSYPYNTETTSKAMLSSSPFFSLDYSSSIRNKMGIHYSIIGDPSLQIYRLRLPCNLLHLLDPIVTGCDNYASTLPNGWKTNLFSLTKQDIALRDIPHLYNASVPITAYIKRCIAYLYYYNNNNNNISSQQQHPQPFSSDVVKLDRNQPHVLKYSATPQQTTNANDISRYEQYNRNTNDASSHTGVELHFDKCDVTANLCMSRSTSYNGGGTFFPDVGKVIRLEFGEFILHPGSTLHAGEDITNGNRFLLILFCNLQIANRQTNNKST